MSNFCSPKYINIFCYFLAFTPAIQQVLIWLAGFLIGTESSFVVQIRCKQLSRRLSINIS